MSERKSAYYTRVSTSEQKKDGYSLDSQKEKCELLAKVKGENKLLEYSDAGISGKRDDRPAYQRLIRDIEQGIVGRVYIWRLDRLSRNLRSFLDLVELLNENEVELISVSESIDTTSSAGRLMLKNLMSFSEYFLEVLSENIKAGLGKRVDNGGWITTAPTGADIVEKKLVWNGKSHQVKKAFELAAEDKSYREIAEATGLNQNSLWYFLKNPVYAGYVKVKGEVYEGEHEPLISKELFDRVQEVKKPTKRNWRNKTPHPLSGFIRCGKCGRSMTVRYSGKGVMSYTCKHRGGNPCDGVGSRSARKLEKVLLAGLRLLKENHNFRKELREYWLAKEPPEVVEEQIEKTKRQLTGIKRKRDKMANLLLEDGIDADDFKDIKVELIEREKQLLKELDAFGELAKENERHAESLEELLDLLDRISFEDIWNEATEIERKWILEDYLRAIVIHPEYAEVQFYDVPAFRVDWSEVNGKKDVCISMERETGLESATFSLGS